MLSRELMLDVTEVHGRQRLAVSVWSLAPTTHPAFTTRTGAPARFGKAAETETVWAQSETGRMFWVAFDHRTGEVLAHVESKVA